MTDNIRKYRAIRDALKRIYSSEPKGNFARHLNTLAWFILGIVTSRRTNLPEIASKVPDGSKRESRVKRMYRWLNNEGIEFELYFLPFAQAVLLSLAQAQGTLTLAIDGSAVGRGCVTLMVSVIYQRRALPIAWIVIAGKKGHFPENTHISLLEQVRNLMPEGIKVVLVGDGEFDGIELQAAVEKWGWKYVCRTAKNISLMKDDQKFSYETLGVKEGECIARGGVSFTNEAYGPVLAIAWWEKGYEEPIYLVSNMESKEEACRYYKKRFRIETFFSDQKSRGFHLHKSHISDPKRLARLMIAACLAYIWMIFLGVKAVKEGWIEAIHRKSRCDLSLFRLGMDLLDHLVNQNYPIPVAFHLNV